MNEASAKSLIRKSILKTKAGLLLTALLAGSMGAYLGLNLFMQWEPMSLGMQILSAVISLVFLAVTALMLKAAFTPSPLVRLIFKEPSRIAWIYTENIRLYNRESQNVNLYIYDIAKKRHFLMSTKKNIDGLVAVLKDRAPHAKFGFDPEFEKKFRA